MDEDETEQSVRPRFGHLIAPDGATYPLVFHPDPDDPMVFRACLAGDERPAVLGSGTRIQVDVLGAGQSVTFTMPVGTS